MIARKTIRSLAFVIFCVVGLASLLAYVAVLSLRLAKLEALVSAREVADPLMPVECTWIKGPCPVKFERLLAAPQQFQNRLIRLDGFYVRSFETSALYEYRENLQDKKTAGIWISAAQGAGSHLKKVTVVGVFKRGPAGHMFDYAGEIENAQLFPNE